MARDPRGPGKEVQFYDDLDQARLKSGWSCAGVAVILVGLYLLGLWVILSWF